MGEEEYIVPSGPLKGKKIEMASTAGVHMFEEIAREFMLQIFGLEPGAYLITDESSLRDFVVADDMKLADIHRKIEGVFSLDVSDLKSGKLLEIFVRIHERQSGGE